ncbi:MAG: polysaccharide deacetylase family protein [Candidatus Bathyarchaeota archaeon]
MTDVCLGFNVHQPFRLKGDFFWLHREFSRTPVNKLFDYYFDNKLNKDVLKRVCEKSYLPSNNILLEEIEKFKGENKKVKVFFSLSGVFLEQCTRWAEHVLESFKQLILTGCVELISQPYYNSLCSLWPEKDEFIEQVRIYEKKIREIFNLNLNVFKNTELIYNNEIAKLVDSLGYKGIIIEGVERIIKPHLPNNLFKPKGCSKVLILPRNPQLSEVVTYNFSNRLWFEWPLTPEKYARMLSSTSGQCILILLDYAFFGEHCSSEDGVHNFLKNLFEEVVKRENLEFMLPSEVLERHKPVKEIDVNERDETISWGGLKKDLDLWLGNSMQVACYTSLKEMGKQVKESWNKNFLKVWRLLQTSDYLYYMSTVENSEDLSGYFNPYTSPYNAFLNYVSVILDFRVKVKNFIILAKKPFKFYLSKNHYTGVAVQSLSGLLHVLKLVDAKSIEYSLKNRSFENWFAKSLEDHELAEKIKALRFKNCSGEKLRRKLYSLILNHYKKKLNKKLVNFYPLFSLKEKDIKNVLMLQHAEHVLRKLPVWKVFWFNSGKEGFYHVYASSLPELYERIPVVDVSSLELSIKNGSLIRWVKEVVGDDELAAKLEKVKNLSLTGEGLREMVYKTVKERCNELLRIVRNKHLIV